jgi:AAA ATPase domain
VTRVAEQIGNCAGRDSCDPARVLTDERLGFAWFGSNGPIERTWRLPDASARRARRSGVSDWNRPSGRPGLQFRWQTTGRTRQSDPEGMMIHRFRVRVFKSIADVDVDLSPVTVLVGRSGTGKSNFVQALRFLRDVRIRWLSPILRAPACNLSTAPQANSDFRTSRGRNSPGCAIGSR